MPGIIELKLSEEEVEMLIDALEADQEGYVEAAKEARGNNRRDEVATFTEAAQRIDALMGKLRKVVAE